MRDAADRAIDRWPLDRAFSLHEEFQRITLDIILETVFGLSEGETFEHFRELFVRLLNVGSHPSVLFLSAMLPASRLLRLLSLGSEPVRLGPLKVEVSRALPWTQLSRLLREVDAYLFAEFARRRAAGLEGREDVLSMLMQARDEDGQPMSDPELRPERFLGRRLNPYEYFPFGGGARRCLGMAFASYEMKIVFAEVLRRVRLRPATRYALQVRRRGTTLAPGDGVPVLVGSRAHGADTSSSAWACSV